MSEISQAQMQPHSRNHEHYYALRSQQQSLRVNLAVALTTVAPCNPSRDPSLVLRQGFPNTKFFTCQV